MVQNALENIAKIFDTQMIMPLQQVLVGRKLFPVNTALSNKGLGLQSVDYWTFGDISDAIINYAIQDRAGNEDTVDATASTIKIPVIKSDYKVDRRAYESFVLKGIEIDTDVALRAAYKVAVQEDTMLLDGWKPDGTNYAVKGLYQLANNVESTSLVFSTFGNAVKKVAAAIALLEADLIYGPYNMVLNPTQANQLLGSISSTGAPELPIVQRMLNKGPSGFPADEAGGGQIMSSPIMAANTGMIVPVQNPIYFDLVVAQDARNILGLDSKQPDVSPIYGSVYEALVPRIKKTDAICQLTGI